MAHLVDRRVQALGRREFLALSGPNSGFLRYNGGPLANDSSGNLYTVNEERVLKMRDCQVTLLADLKPLLDKSTIFMPNNASGIAADSKGNIYASTTTGGKQRQQQQYIFIIEHSRRVCSIVAGLSRACDGRV